MNKQTYFDHAATSPMHPEVIQVMTQAMTEHYGNASSIHQIGRESKGVLEEARVVFAKSIHAEPKEIILTSGGTESDNTAIMGTARKFKSKGKHIISTAVEHPAVREPLLSLEKEGYVITFLPVNEEGFITADQVEEALREDTILVSIIYGNNEVGTIQPIEDIGQMLANQDRKILFHTDAVQAYGTEKIDVKKQHIDMLSVSSHKINGPKGIGFLYVNKDMPIPSMMLGGEQENKKRAGTENIPAILGFQKAVELRQAQQDELRQEYKGLKHLVVQTLEEKGINYTVNGSLENSLPHILSLHLPGVPAERLLIHLDLATIAVSIGSACSAGNVDPSHVLTALYGGHHPAISETIRISFGLGNNEEGIHYLIDNIEKAIAFLS